MPLVVPVAFDKLGDLVLPTCEKSRGAFKCIECSERLSLRQGEIKEWHFAHVSVGTRCEGGDKPLRLRAAKMIIAQYMPTINFVQKCRKGRHVHVRRYGRYTASQEYECDGHLEDVALLGGRELEASVRIDLNFPFETTREPISGDLVSPGNVWEVNEWATHTPATYSAVRCMGQPPILTATYSAAVSVEILRMFPRRRKEFQCSTRPN